MLLNGLINYSRYQSEYNDLQGDSGNVSISHGKNAVGGKMDQGELNIR